jgi:hypothetical protein
LRRLETTKRRNEETKRKESLSPGGVLNLPEGRPFSVGSRQLASGKINNGGEWKQKEKFKNG